MWWSELFLAVFFLLPFQAMNSFTHEAQIWGSEVSLDYSPRKSLSFVDHSFSEMFPRLQRILCLSLHTSIARRLTGALGPLAFKGKSIHQRMSLFPLPRKCRSFCHSLAHPVAVFGRRRLEALSVDQGGDIARLEASLRLPRRPGALSAVATAAGVPREVSGRAGVGGAGEEKSAAAAAALDAEGVAIAPLPSPASGSTAAAAATAAGGEGGERGASPGEGRDRERSRSRAASPPAEMRTEWEVRAFFARY